MMTFEQIAEDCELNEEFVTAVRESGMKDPIDVMLRDGEKFSTNPFKAAEFIALLQEYDGDLTPDVGATSRFLFRCKTAGQHVGGGGGAGDNSGGGGRDAAAKEDHEMNAASAQHEKAYRMVLRPKDRVAPVLLRRIRAGLQRRPPTLIADAFKLETASASDAADDKTVVLDASSETTIHFKEGAEAPLGTMCDVIISMRRMLTAIGIAGGVACHEDIARNSTHGHIKIAGEEICVLATQTELDILLWDCVDQGRRKSPNKLIQSLENTRPTIIR